ncbi:hypothetical protein HDU97_010218 [Phlyctochytrium planicorne]|nr:hypothetical protein HDU97_010218 [Phlyctochytrium planicorne]
MFRRGSGEASYADGAAAKGEQVAIHQADSDSQSVSDTADDALTTHAQHRQLQHQHYQQQHHLHNQTYHTQQQHQHHHQQQQQQNQSFTHPSPQSPTFPDDDSILMEDDAIDIYSRGGMPPHQHHLLQTSNNSNNNNLPASTPLPPLPPRPETNEKDEVHDPLLAQYGVGAPVPSHEGSPAASMYTVGESPRVSTDLDMDHHVEHPPLLFESLANGVSAVAHTARVSIAAAAAVSDAALATAKWGTSLTLGMGRSILVGALSSARVLHRTPGATGASTNPHTSPDTTQPLAIMDANHEDHGIESASDRMMDGALIAAGSNGGPGSNAGTVSRQRPNDLWLFHQALDTYTDYSVGAVNHLFSLAELFTCATWHLARSSVRFTMRAAQETVQIFDGIFGSTETSRALSALVQLIRDEMNELNDGRGSLPGQGVLGKTFGTIVLMGSLTKALTAFACLQFMTSRRTMEMRRLTRLYEGIVGDGVGEAFVGGAVGAGRGGAAGAGGVLMIEGGARTEHVERVFVPTDPMDGDGPGEEIVIRWHREPGSDDLTVEIEERFVVNHGDDDDGRSIMTLDDARSILEESGVFEEEGGDGVKVIDDASSFIENGREFEGKVVMPDLGNSVTSLTKTFGVDVGAAGGMVPPRSPATSSFFENDDDGLTFSVGDRFGGGGEGSSSAAGSSSSSSNSSASLQPGGGNAGNGSSNFGASSSTRFAPLSPISPGHHPHHLHGGHADHFRRTAMLGPRLGSMSTASIASMASTNSSSSTSRRTAMEENRDLMERVSRDFGGKELRDLERVILMNQRKSVVGVGAAAIGVSGGSKGGSVGRNGGGSVRMSSGSLKSYWYKDLPPVPGHLRGRESPRREGGSSGNVTPMGTISGVSEIVGFDRDGTVETLPSELRDEDFEERSSLEVSVGAADGSGEADESFVTARSFGTGASFKSSGSPPVVAKMNVPAVVGSSGSGGSGGGGGLFGGFFSPRRTSKPQPPSFGSSGGSPTALSVPDVQDDSESVQSFRTASSSFSGAQQNRDEDGASSGAAPRKISFTSMLRGMISPLRGGGGGGGAGGVGKAAANVMRKAKNSMVTMFDQTSTVEQHEDGAVTTKKATTRVHEAGAQLFGSNGSSSRPMSPSLEDDRSRTPVPSPGAILDEPELRQLPKKLHKRPSIANVFEARVKDEDSFRTPVGSPRVRVGELVEDVEDEDTVGAASTSQTRPVAQPIPVRPAEVSMMTPPDSGASTPRPKPAMLIGVGKEVKDSRDGMGAVVATVPEKQPVNFGHFPLRNLLKNLERYARFGTAAYGRDLMILLGIGKIREIHTTDAHHHVNHYAFAIHTGIAVNDILHSSFGGSFSTHRHDTGSSLPTSPVGSYSAAGGSQPGKSSPSRTGSTSKPLHALPTAAPTQPRMQPLNHYVALDRLARVVVVALRGTLGLSDVLTDMRFDYADFRGGRVHAGMLRSAAMKFRKGTVVFEAVDRALRENPGYGLVLTGHSLGGGVAALMALEWACPVDSSDVPPIKSPRTPFVTSISSGLPPGRPIHCYSFGSPCVATFDLAMECKGLVSTLVNGDDIVPTMSLGLVRDFKIVTMYLLDPTNKGLSERIISRTLGLQKTATGGNSAAAGQEAGAVPAGMEQGAGGAPPMEEGEFFWNIMTRLRQSMNSERLYPPGLTYWMSAAAVTETRDAKTGVKKTVSRVVLQRCDDVREMFNEPRFSSRVMSDHTPRSYEDAIDALVKAIFGPRQQQQGGLVQQESQQVGGLIGGAAGNGGVRTGPMSMNTSGSWA